MQKLSSLLTELTNEKQVIRLKVFSLISCVIFMRFQKAVTRI